MRKGKRIEIIKVLRTLKKGLPVVYIYIYIYIKIP